MGRREFVSFKLNNGELLRISDYQDTKGYISNKMFKILKENGVEDFDEYYDKLRIQLINDLKNNFQFYESKGLKCLFWNMTGNFNNLINDDEYLKNRLITFDYNGKNYSCWHEMFEDNNFDLEIIGDNEFFGKITPKDRHPSKKAHQIIAQNIIKKIEENEKID